MKILLINGSPHEFGCTYTALNEVARTLRKHEIETEIDHLGIQPISGCIDCGKCARSKKCVFDDKVNETLDKIASIDGIVIGSPVYYASPSGQLISFLDRFFHCGGAQMAGKLGAAVVSCRRGGASAAFDCLNKYFTISKMPVVSSQYWNQVHGYVPEDVMKDEEGLQTMRTLGENMAWLLKCIAAGRMNGVEEPKKEAILRTNFIR